MTWVVGLRSQADPIEDSTIRNTSGNFLFLFFIYFLFFVILFYYYYFLFWFNEIFGFMFVFFIEMHYSSKKKLHPIREDGY